MVAAAKADAAPRHARPVPARANRPPPRHAECWPNHGVTVVNLAGAATVLLAALVNIATGVLTQEWAAAWWAATAVLVVIGGAVHS